MKTTALSLALLAIVTRVAADGGRVWGQCGGINFVGPTVCDPGSICTYINEFYSQCIPRTYTIVPTSQAATSTAVLTPTPYVA
ncbi:hypothetical protein BDV93DRAFT_550182 [Ceratobasidium sp. AG-I]|nr:hypothetical protein BDV93DRAFT_550182 [Ceratobasidium sp. AG-I]